MLRKTRLKQKKWFSDKKTCIQSKIYTILSKIYIHSFTDLNHHHHRRRCNTSHVPYCLNIFSPPTVSIAGDVPL